MAKGLQLNRKELAFGFINFSNFFRMLQIYLTFAQMHLK